MRLNVDEEKERERGMERKYASNWKDRVRVIGKEVSLKKKKKENRKDGIKWPNYSVPSSDSVALSRRIQSIAKRQAIRT